MFTRYASTFKTRSIASAFGVLVLFTIGSAVFATAAAASKVHPAKPCSGSARATLSLTKDAQTSFVLNHGDDRLVEDISLTSSGCKLPVTRPGVQVDVFGSNGPRDYHVKFINRGDGVAFVHLTAQSANLPDGTRTVRLVVSGKRIVTSVIPVTIQHQYRTQWLVIVFAVVGWAAGLFIAAAHAVSSASSDSPGVRETWDVLRHHWFAAVLTVGAAYGAYVAGYDTDHSFRGGTVSLIALAAKVGAASTAAAVLTSTAGAAASAAGTALAARKTRTHPTVPRID
jgi:hypothetical protein